MKALVFLTLILIKYLLFMMTGKISQLTKLLLGVSNMILEMLKIDGLKGVCSKKTKSKDKNKRKITSKLSRIL